MIAEMTTQRAFAYVIGALIFVGGAFYVIAQMRRGRKEVGAEIELAANRKTYLSDEELEGPKLNMALWTSFGLLVITALTLPLYWLNEGGRQDGAVEMFDETFERRGEATYVEGAQCVNCHGPEGVGGVASFIITDENGEFVQQVNWNAPALNTVLYRYSNAEVIDVLTYGRPGSPMAAWGVAGGGPLTSQQLQNVVDYLWTVQLTPEEMRAELDEAIEARAPELYERMIENRELNDGIDPTDEEAYTRMDEADELWLGEVLFGLSDLGAGAYSCARCHVPGAAFGQPYADVADSGRGAFAFNLEGVQRKLTERQHFSLIWLGSEYGVQYGSNSQGSGRMPGFGVNANNEGDIDRRGFGPAGMYSAEQVWAVVTYERNLEEARAGASSLDVPIDATLTEDDIAETPTDTDLPTGGAPELNPANTANDTGDGQ